MGEGEGDRGGLKPELCNDRGFQKLVRNILAAPDPGQSGATSPCGRAQREKSETELGSAVIGNGTI